MFSPLFQQREPGRISVLFSSLYSTFLEHHRQLLALRALRNVIGRHKEHLMTGSMYSKRLGLISDEQLQVALDRFHLGRFSGAEPIPFGAFGQNLFVSSTKGGYVLRGNPLLWWQFPTEQFYARFLHERAYVPA